METVSEMLFLYSSTYKDINSLRLYLQYRAVKPPFCCISDKDWTIPFTMLKKIQDT